MTAYSASAWSAVAHYIAHDYVSMLALCIVPMVPFIIAERLRPAGETPPTFKQYGFNVLITITTYALAPAVGVVAATWADRLRPLLPWPTIEFAFSDIHTGVPFLDPVARIVAMIGIPLIMHDLWFYWSHRLEHTVPVLWRFHRLHHSDPNMNVSTFSRDHLLQQVYRSFISIFTVGLIFDLDLKQAQSAAIYYNCFTVLWSMFYHSAIRVRLAWLDRVLVTPQIHRIHHSLDPEHFNRNFADNLPIFDILFGTYEASKPGHYPATGLAEWAPKTLLDAQVGPIVAALRLITGRPAQPQERADPG